MLKTNYKVMINQFILVLSSFDKNKTASGPTSLHTSNKSSMKDFETYNLHFFPILFSGLRSLTGTIFTWTWQVKEHLYSTDKEEDRGIRQFNWSKSPTLSIPFADHLRLLRYGGTLSYYVQRQLLNSVLILQWWKLARTVQFQ